jgi:hypothetical protein
MTKTVESTLPVKIAALTEGLAVADDVEELELATETVVVVTGRTVVVVRAALVVRVLVVRVVVVRVVVVRGR